MKHKDYYGITAWLGTSTPREVDVHSQLLQVLETNTRLTRLLNFTSAAHHFHIEPAAATHISGCPAQLIIHRPPRRLMFDARTILASRRMVTLPATTATVAVVILQVHAAPVAANLSMLALIPTFPAVGGVLADAAAALGVASALVVAFAAVVGVVPECGLGKAAALAAGLVVLALVVAMAAVVAVGEEVDLAALVVITGPAAVLVGAAGARLPVGAVAGVPAACVRICPCKGDGQEDGPPEQEEN